jgi:membrane protein implicated in regulation of membrane protease activity
LGSDEEDASLLKMIDDLIYRLNSERIWFQIILIVSLVMAPISLLITLFFLLHPRLLLIVLGFGRFAGPSLGMLMLAYVIVNFVVASLWLAIGIREFRFFRKWDQRFRRYFSLKERLDEELRREFEEEQGEGR